jgi:hypothetical protein
MQQYDDDLVNFGRLGGNSRAVHLTEAEEIRSTGDFTKLQKNS